MKILKLSLVFFFFSCFTPDKNGNDKTKPYAKIWESQDKIKKVRSFKVIKDQERIVGYIDEEYADKIFNLENKNESLPETKNEENTETKPSLQPESAKVETNLEKSEQQTATPPNFTTFSTKAPPIKNPTSKNVSTPKKSPKPIQPKVQANAKTSTTNKNEIDFSKLNFYYSELKLAAKSKTSGSFKINLTNNSGQNLSESFFKKLICRVEVIEGDDAKILLTNFKGQTYIDGQSLWAIKNSFHKDLNAVIKFSLLGIASAKVKISFHFNDDPTKVCVVKKNNEDFVFLESKS